MAKTVLVLLADGFEEIEAVTPVDILRRAGVEVVVAGVGGLELKGAHGMTIRADVAVENVKDLPDAVVLPGGMPGASNLKESPAVISLLKRMKEKDKIIAAICASPGLALAASGVLDGKKATCYPGFEKGFGPKTAFVRDRVVTDGKIVTSRGPGTALEFSLELVRRLVSEKIADSLKNDILAII
ncbi:MAG: DJ-1/PfpI family protein [Candidatus Omnitrophica bacterium]|nr:DJ-1/PfpI family protein [Candidatus Omnitrophota bacterium]